MKNEADIKEWKENWEKQFSDEEIKTIKKNWKVPPKQCIGKCELGFCVFGHVCVTCNFTDEFP